MRIWVDPDKLAQHGLMVGDVTQAVRAQNTQVSAGQLGALPQRRGQQLNATVTAGSRLQTVEQFEAIILNSAADGSVIRLSDVATVELGAESYTNSSTYSGTPAAGIGFRLRPGPMRWRRRKAFVPKLSGNGPIFRRTSKSITRLTHRLSFDCRSRVWW